MNLKVGNTCDAMTTVKETEHTVGKVSTNSVRKTGYTHVKNRIVPLPYTIHKNQLKMD